MRKKIAHLQLLPMLSGVQRVSYQELAHLDEGIEAHILCKERGELVTELEAVGVSFRGIPSLQRAIHPWKDFQAFCQLYSLFKSEEYDVVHTHSSKTGFLGRLAAKLAGVPCIVHTIHGFAFPAAKSKFEYIVYWLLEWIAGRCCDVVIALTESDRLICTKSLGIDESSVRLLPNAVDRTVYYPVNELDRSSLRKSVLSEDVDEVVAVMVGRMWEQKAPELFVRAAIRAFEQSGNLRLKLYLVGDGELRNGLEKEVAEAGLSERIKFLGWRSDVPDILRASDIFVLPSRWEGMPLAILEALATKLAVVVSDIPGNRAALGQRECGVTFPAESVDDLSTILVQLTEHSEMRRKYAEKGCQHISDNHDLENRICKIRDLYNQILSSKL
ncbi:glycosyltransferase family 4 protein [Rubritalea tangerina]|uniref:Glycosyltransferase family 4 protein n=1 Tax=Rubritalea tangerina TaxID=430798 RepID=A0ABW4ZBE6_9BACT